MIDHYSCLNALMDGLSLMAKRGDVIRDTHGNLSCISPGGMIYIKPSGVPYEQITADMIPGVAVADGLQETGLGYKPSVDLPHHLEIYRKLPWLRAICHTHSPYATAFAIAGLGIPCMSTEQSDYFGGPVRCLPYADLDNWGRQLNPASGERAFLLERHGVITFGDTPRKAVELAVALENCAMKVHLAKNIAITEVKPMPREEIKKWNDRYQNVYGQR
jgi:L-ribulose-5-phosphate 4-epimerase